jgi:hypothetical protein
MDYVERALSIIVSKSSLPAKPMALKVREPVSRTCSISGQS